MLTPTLDGFLFFFFLFLERFEFELGLKLSKSGCKPNAVG